MGEEEQVRINDEDRDDPQHEREAAPQQAVKDSQRRSYWRGVFSDGGEPSSSRVISGYLFLVVSVIVAVVFVHLIRSKDLSMVSLWLGALPGLIYALMALAIAPYTVNRSTGSISDLASLFRK